MAVVSLFSNNFRTLRRPAAALWAQFSSRNVTSCSVFHHKVQLLPATGLQQCHRRDYLNTAPFAIRPSPPSIHSGQVRLLSQLPPPEQAQPDDGHEEEDFEEHERTIYKGILATQIKLVKTFSLMTSVIGLACQPVLFMKMGEGGGNVALIVASGAFLSFFTFATPLLIHYVSKKYVVELIYNKIDDTYTAVTYSLLLRKKEVKFKVSDVYVPDIPGMFTTFKANNVPLFVDGDQFETPTHYGKIMGYDKPINFRWEGEHTQSEAEARRKKKWF